jgi:type VI secretion system secreted protein VgrG
MARVFDLMGLGGKDLEFDSMSCQERLGRMFEYKLTAVSERGDLKAAQFLGKSITVRMTIPNKPVRYFNGYCVQMMRGMMRGEWFTYVLVLKPWIWFLTRTSDCKINSASDY